MSLVGGLADTVEFVAKAFDVIVGVEEYELSLCCCRRGRSSSRRSTAGTIESGFESTASGLFGGGILITGSLGTIETDGFFREQKDGIKQGSGLIADLLGEACFATAGVASENETGHWCACV